MAKFLVFLLMISIASGQKLITIVLVGDSTVNDEGGWGQGFRASLVGPLTVINLAKNGRSSKSFRDEGLWAPVLTRIADFVLIQFGHNDEPEKAPIAKPNPAPRIAPT